VKVSITLKASDLAYWDTDKKTFTLEKGKVILMMGSSSADIRLKGEISVE
jgi:beta-glucosidase